jgi:hypothetical protein
MGHVALCNLRRLADQFPTLVFEPRAAHARALRALTRKGERKHDV